MAAGQAACLQPVAGGIRIVYICVFSTHALASLYRTGKHFPKEGLTGHIAANARS